MIVDAMVGKPRRLLQMESVYDWLYVQNDSSGHWYRPRRKLFRGNL